MAMPKIGEMNIFHVIILVFVALYVMTETIDIDPVGIIDDVMVMIGGLVALLIIPTK